MPSYADVGRIIESHLDSNWSYTPIAFDNVSFVDFDGVTRPVLAEGEAPFIFCRILFNTSEAAEVGQGGIKRTWGNLAIDFHTRRDQGTKTNQTNIDNLASIFEYTTISGVVFRNLDVFRPLNAGGWYITPTMVRFYFNR